MRYAILALVLVGCASTRIVTVTSTAPAQIDMDGMTVCETTPCEIALRCNDPYMWQAPNSLSATPKEKGMVQQRSLNACQVPTGSRVNFEMGLTYQAPVQRQEITIKDKRKLPAPTPR
jgi:hypothetical protein